MACIPCPAMRVETVKLTIMSRTGTKTISLNRRQAIKERCLNCSAWSPSEVDDCHFTDCALYLYRTGKGRQSATDRNRAIRTYCLWCCNDQPKEVRLCPTGECALHPYRMGKSSTVPGTPLSAESPHIEVDFSRGER